MNKEAQKVRSRRWYDANKELAKERARLFYAADREAINAANKVRDAARDPVVKAAKRAAYYAKNRTKQLAEQKAFRDANKDLMHERDAAKYQKRRAAVLKKCAERYREKAESIKANVRRWVSENKDLVSVYKRNNHARRNAATGSHSLADIRWLVALQKGKCAICRINISAKRHVDHMMPLCLGGSNDQSNLQLLCPTCNMRKGGKHPIAFAQENGRLL